MNSHCTYPSHQQTTPICHKKNRVTMNRIPSSRTPHCSERQGRESERRAKGWRWIAWFSLSLYWGVSPIVLICNISFHITAYSIITNSNKHSILHFLCLLLNLFKRPLLREHGNLLRNLRHSMEHARNAIEHVLSSISPRKPTHPKLRRIEVPATNKNTILLATIGSTDISRIR